MDMTMDSWPSDYNGPSGSEIASAQRAAYLLGKEEGQRTLIEELEKGVEWLKGWETCLRHQKEYDEGCVLCVHRATINQTADKVLEIIRKHRAE